MRGLSWRDRRTFLLAGGVVVGTYVVGMAVLSAGGVLDGVDVTTFVAGFLIFVAVYGVSMSLSGRFE